MKKYLVLTLLMTMILVVTACNSPAQSATIEFKSGSEIQEPDPQTPESSSEVQGPSPQASANASALLVDYENALPLASQLAIGIIKLEESNSPLTEQQAIELRLLWKAAENLSESETAAVEETQAILTQIEEALSSEQLETIKEMQLTVEDMTSVLLNMGIDLQAGRGSGQRLEGASGAAPGGGVGLGGGVPGGGMPGGGNGPGGGEISPEVRETSMAARGVIAPSASRVNFIWANAVVEYLEGITQ